MQKIVVIGAGAMGSLFAARLAEAGFTVTIVDKDVQRLAAIERQGLELSDDQGTRVVRVQTAKAESVAEHVDLIILFTKGMHSEAAVKSVSHLAKNKPLTLTLQNGIGNAEALATEFGPDRVVMGTAMIPSDLGLPNKVRTHGEGLIEVGGYAETSLTYVNAVAEVLQLAGFQPKVTECVESAVWEKLAFNAALNAPAMITFSNNAQLNNPQGIYIAKAVLEETIAVANARGLRLDRQKLERDISAALTKYASHEASMLQDRRHGRATEVRSINGAIAGEGARLNVSTPVNETLASLILLIEANELASPRLRDTAA